MTAISVSTYAPASDQPHANFRAVKCSHVGLVRAINEDRVFVSVDTGLFAVADGMGGHAGGDLAAQAAVDQLRALTTSGRKPIFADVLNALGKANDDICRRNNQLRTDAGTTVVAALVDGATAHIAWAGDSRAYRLRRSLLELLTRDHSMVQELIDAGLLTEESAKNHPQSHIVTRALGINSETRLQTLSVELMQGDQLLLCSDGLSRTLGNVEIVTGELETMAEQLLAYALAHDGDDNISFVLVDQTIA